MISTTAATTRLVISYLVNRALSPPQFFTKNLLFPSCSTLHFHRYAHFSTFSTSASVIDAHISVHVPESGVNLHHPWPEWVLFVDKLNSKGYLSNGGVDTPQVAHKIDYRDMNMMRNACLSFARDRLDIFQCNFMNFYRNLQCRECGEDEPRKVSRADVELKKGDWICPECSYMNFSRNVSCLKCEAEGPKRVSADVIEMKKGDWSCPQCQFKNFASNKKCKRCQEVRPKRELIPGDWECPSCDYLNYAKNVICRKCDGDGPNEKVETRNEDQLWRKPPPGRVA